MDSRDRESSRRWYVIHTYSGYENKVKVNLEKKIESQNLQDEIFNVIVPMQDEVETTSSGEQKVVKRKVFPGYVLVDMIVNDRSWYVVRNTQGVTGFVGTEKDPVPLSDEEAQRILGSIDEPLLPKSTAFAAGDNVRIMSGWMQDHEGVVTAVDSEEKRLKVEVDGKSLELEFGMVKKI